MPSKSRLIVFSDWWHRAAFYKGKKEEVEKKVYGEFWKYHYHSQ